MPRVRNVLLACVALMVAWATAQSTIHGVTISVPDVAGIRIIGAGGGPRAVLFDYATDPTTYLDAVNGGGTLLPTSVNRFSDVELFITSNGQWSLRIVAEPFTFSGDGSGAGLEVGDIVVRRGIHSGLAQSAVTWQGNSGFYLSSWALSTVQLTVASSNRSSGGWKSLGFSGLDYELNVDGSESPGSYVTTVTYLLTRP